MKFFKGFFLALLFDLILIFVAFAGIVCGVCIAKNSKIAEELDKCFSQSVITQSLSPCDVSESQYSFSGSNLFMPIARINSTAERPSAEDVIDNEFHFFSIGLNAGVCTIYYDNVVAYSWFQFDIVNGWHVLRNAVNQSISYYLFYELDNGFNYNVSRVSIGTYPDFGNNYSLRTSSILYYDSNGACFKIGFCYKPDFNRYNDDKFAYSWRDYYLSNPSNWSDNQVYDSGYVYGYSEGASAGKSSGYSDGYNTGNRVGYQIGYNAGVADSNDYSFLSLIGAVVDAPLAAFTNLLNFEILGFNFLSLITGILTIGLLFVFIRFIFFRR